MPRFWPLANIRQFQTNFKWTLQKTASIHVPIRIKDNHATMPMHWTTKIRYQVSTRHAYLLATENQAIERVIPRNCRTPFADKCCCHHPIYSILEFQSHCCRLPSRSVIELTFTNSKCQWRQGNVRLLIKGQGHTVGVGLVLLHGSKT